MKKIILLIIYILCFTNSYSQVSLATIKSYFETGDKPTQAQFWTAWDYSYNTVSDGIFDLTGGTSIQVAAYTSSSAGVWYSGSTVPTDTNNIMNWNGKLRATKLYIGSTEVGTGSGYWNQTESTSIHPLTISDGVVIGNDSLTNPYKFQVVGQSYLNGDVKVVDRIYLDSTLIYIERNGDNLRFYDPVTGGQTLASLASAGVNYWQQGAYGSSIIPYNSTDTVIIRGNNNLLVESIFYVDDGLIWLTNNSVISFDGTSVNPGISMALDKLSLSDVSGSYYLEDLASATSFTFRNGLSETGNISELGGTLIKNTKVDLSNYYLDLRSGTGDGLLLYPYLGFATFDVLNLDIGNFDSLYFDLNTVSAGTDMIITDNTFQPGLEYNDNFGNISDYIITNEDKIPNIRAVKKYMRSGFNFWNYYIGFDNNIYLSRNDTSDVYMRFVSLSNEEIHFKCDPSNNNSMVQADVFDFNVTSSYSTGLNLSVRNSDSSLIYNKNGTQYDLISGSGAAGNSYEVQYNLAGVATGASNIKYYGSDSTVVDNRLIMQDGELENNFYFNTSAYMASTGASNIRMYLNAGDIIFSYSGNGSFISSDYYIFPDLTLAGLSVGAVWRDDSYLLFYDGSQVDTLNSGGSGGSGTPGGNNTDFQYNNGGSFAGTDSMTYNHDSVRITTLLKVDKFSLSNYTDESILFLDGDSVSTSANFQYDGNYIEFALNDGLEWTNVHLTSSGTSFEIDYSGTDQFVFSSLNATAQFYANATNGALIIEEVPSSTNPVFTFRGDDDTGIGRNSADELSFITNSVERLNVKADTITINEPILKFNNYNNQIHSDVTGFLVYCLGTNYWEMDAVQLAATSGGPSLRYGAASRTTAAIRPRSSNNTGFASNSTIEMSFVVNGSEEIRVENDSTTFFNDIVLNKDIGTDTVDLILIGHSGYAIIDTASFVDPASWMIKDYDIGSFDDYWNIVLKREELGLPTRKDGVIRENYWLKAPRNAADVQLQAELERNYRFDKQLRDENKVLKRRVIRLERQLEELEKRISNLEK